MSAEEWPERSNGRHALLVIHAPRGCESSQRWPRSPGRRHLAFTSLRDMLQLSPGNLGCLGRA